MKYKPDYREMTRTFQHIIVEQGKLEYIMQDDFPHPERLDETLQTSIALIKTHTDYLQALLNDHIEKAIVIGKAHPYKPK